MYPGGRDSDTRLRLLCAFELTPAAERALEAAAAWTSSNDPDDLGVPEVLLGLLAEPECRAALLLAQCGVDAAAVRRRFPTLAPAGAAAARANRSILRGACRLLATTAESLLVDYPRPLFLATEHVLLGIVAAQERGFALAGRVRPARRRARGRSASPVGSSAGAAAAGH